MIPIVNYQIITFLLVRVHAKRDADGKKIQSNFKSVRTKEMIEEEKSRLHDESLDEFINEFNEDPFDKLMKEKWMQLRAKYQDHLMCDNV